MISPQSILLNMRAKIEKKMLNYPKPQKINAFPICPTSLSHPAESRNESPEGCAKDGDNIKL